MNDYEVVKRFVEICGIEFEETVSEDAVYITGNTLQVPYDGDGHKFTSVGYDEVWLAFKFIGGELSKGAIDSHVAGSSSNIKLIEAELKEIDRLSEGSNK